MKQMNAREQGYVIMIFLILMTACITSLFANDGIAKQADVQYQQKQSVKFSSVVNTTVVFKTGYTLNHEYNNNRAFKPNRLYAIIKWNNTNKETITMVDGHELEYPFVLHDNYLLFYHYFLSTDKQGNKWLIKTY